ncbi:MAG: hypothetical protein R3A80_14120 [Bdellovibrionota bacterium]
MKNTIHINERLREVVAQEKGSSLCGYGFVPSEPRIISRDLELQPSDYDNAGRVRGEVIPQKVLAAWYAFENLFWDHEVASSFFQRFDLHLVESICNTNPVKDRVHALDIHWAIWNLRGSSLNIVYDIEAIIEGHPNRHVFNGTMDFQCFKKGSFDYAPFPESVYGRYFCIEGMIKNGWRGKTVQKKLLSEDN